jgi:hypothetical protein
MSREHEGGYRSSRITTATTTQVKTSVGTVIRVLIEVALVGTVTFNDSTGTKTILPVALPAGLYDLNIAFAGKIEVVTSAADRVVVVYD